MWWALFGLAWAQEESPLELPAPAPPGSILLKGGRLVDGSGAPPVVEDLLVHDGQIVARGPELDPQQAERTLELQGATVTPGLIDSHVHVTVASGEGLFDWSQETLDARRQHQLRAYVAAGVTTVLDCAASWQEIDRVRGWMEAGMTAPQLLTLGEPPIAPGTYGASVDGIDLPILETPAQIADYMAAHAQRSPAGVKLLIEDGILQPVWELPELSWWQSVADSAAEHQLPLFAHSMGAEETLMALQLESKVLLHGLTREHEEAEAALIQAKVPVVATLHVSAATLDPHREGITEPLVELLVHPEVLRAARDPEIRDRSSVAMAAVLMPWLPAWTARWVGRHDGLVEHLVQEQREVTERLIEGGVPLMLGSDAPGWPMMIDNFPGYSTIRELELLVDAGLTPAEALTAGTHRPAQVLGLAEGPLLRPGQPAELVIHAGDPLVDVGAWRDLQYVMRGGVLRTPRAWMEP